MKRPVMEPMLRIGAKNHTKKRWYSMKKIGDIIGQRYGNLSMLIKKYKLLSFRLSTEYVINYKW